MQKPDDFSRTLAAICGALLIGAAGIFIGALFGPVRAPLRNAGEAAMLMASNWRAVSGLKPTEHIERLRPDLSAPRSADITKAQPGVTLATGLFGDRLGARVIGADGVVLHEWPVDFFDVMPEGKLYRYEALVHGAHLYENGDLLINIDKKGMMRVSACGDVVWLNTSQTHHSIDIDDDGFIWAPRGPVRKTAPNLFSHPFYIDEIVRIDPATGAETQVIDLTQVFIDSGAPARLTSLSKFFPDILHVNDVEILGADDASAFPMFAPGDIMISSW